MTPAPVPSPRPTLRGMFAASLALLILAAPAAGAPRRERGQDPVAEEKRAGEESAPPAQPQSRPMPEPERLAAPPGSRHHLFIYLMDGFSATEIRAFGYERMIVPNLTRMMEEGLTLTSVFSVSPWTVPSVASLLTSLYPSAHGAQRAGDRLPASATTLAEVMKEKGYQTALFSAHPLVGPLGGLDQGFDWVEEIPGPFGPEPPKGPAETSETLNKRVLDWLDRRDSRAPTFIVALSGDALEPFGVPGPEGRRYLEEEEYRWYAGVRKKLLDSRPGPLGLATPADLRKIKADPDRFARAARNLYDGAISYNDGQLQVLKEALQARGYWKDALFVVSSTHGEEFGERGIFGHGATLYDTALRVPVVVSYPPVVPKPNQIRKTCDTVDLLPTLLSIMGFPVPEGVQGIERNVEPTVATLALYARAAFAETAPAGALPTGRASMIAETGVKLILYEELPQGMERPEMEFFRGNDPLGWEKRSVLASAPGVAAKKRAILDGWRAVKGKLQLAPDAKPTAPAPRLREILRSLGYLQGMEPETRKQP